MAREYLLDLIDGTERFAAFGGLRTPRVFEPFIQNEVDGVRAPSDHDALIRRRVAACGDKAGVDLGQIAGLGHGDVAVQPERDPRALAVGRGVSEGEADLAARQSAGDESGD